jgi:hypothetical protein
VGLFVVQARLFVGGVLAVRGAWRGVAWVREGERRFCQSMNLVVCVYQKEWL